MWDTRSTHSPEPEPGDWHHGYQQHSTFVETIIVGDAGFAPTAL